MKNVSRDLSNEKHGTKIKEIKDKWSNKNDTH